MLIAAIGLLGLIGLQTNGSSFEAAEVYTWVDASGTTHYSDKPFQKSKKIKLKVAKPDALPIVKAATPAPKAFNANDVDQVVAECANARVNLAAIASGETLFQKDADGNNIKVGSEQIVAQQTQNQKFITAYCTDVPVVVAPDKIVVYGEAVVTKPDSEESNVVESDQEFSSDVNDSDENPNE